MQEMEIQPECQQGLLCIRPSPAHYCATADSLRKQREGKQGVRAATTVLAASFFPPPFPRHQQLAWHGHSCPRRPQPPGRTRRWPAAEARRSHRTYSSWRGHRNPSPSGTRRGPGNLAIGRSVIAGIPSSVISGIDILLLRLLVQTVLLMMLVKINGPGRCLSCLESASTGQCHQHYTRARPAWTLTRIISA